MDKNQQASESVGLKDMYQEYFLDYASYVILERAVPALEDGMKPVQRRILHALKEMDDGRFNKVANVIGQTMQYHPHGDMAIGDAMVNLGQKEIIFDCQGNWGDSRTGDRAAASRYIEVRLSKFALEVAFNNQTTEWQVSYDGRKKEPVNLPMKFPLLLAQGAEGIAVGLSTKILPHNFIELIKASIKILQDKRVKIYPDFQTGGMIDVSDYNGGKRGGKVKVRAVIEQVEKNLLAIKELPYGVTTSSLIDSIIKANDKGKIKVKKVTDNTAKDVEILIELGTGVSAEMMIKALYAFTRCEESISPNACVIVNNKPQFLTVEEILNINTFRTKDLLRQELEIEKKALQEKLLFASLEKIFIQNRIYHQIEECETWEAVIETIDLELKKYVVCPSEKPTADDKRIHLYRDITEEDIVRLTEIKIKRISKFNSFKADELMAKMEEQLKQVLHHLTHLTEYTISYFEMLLEKFGKGRERKTEIKVFDAIQAKRVVVNNAKLYVNRKTGFFGTGLKKDEFVADCSDIDDVISFRKTGTFQVSKIDDKVFAGENIIEIAVWKKGDDRTTYNMIYLDGGSGRTYVKRFNVTAITRDKPYDLTKGKKGSKLLYFSANPNGEAETVTIQLTQACSARKKIFDFDFSTIDIKGRGSQGNILTRYPVRKVSFKEKGKSTLGAIKVWIDEASGRLHKRETGRYLGAFDTGDNRLLVLYKDGSYAVHELDFDKRYDFNNVLEVTKFTPESVVNVVYYEGEKGWTVVKRFHIETNSIGQRFTYINDHAKTKLMAATAIPGAKLNYYHKVNNERKDEELILDTFMDTKGWKSIGNKLSDGRIMGVKLERPKPKDEKEVKAEQKTKTDTPKKDEPLKPGDTIDFDIEPDGQTKLF